MRRNAFSCNSLASSAAVFAQIVTSDALDMTLSPRATDVVQDLIRHAQIEAFTHAPAYTAGMCFAEHARFPSSLLDPLNVNSHDQSANESTLRSFLTCMSTPQEYEEYSHPLEESAEDSTGECRSRRQMRGGGQRERRGSNSETH